MTDDQLLDRIVLNPKVMAGKPVIRGTRLTMDFILNLLAHGVYEKIKQGIWSYNGVFHLVDSWQELSKGRSVFKFKLAAVEGEEDFSVPAPMQSKARRVIPTAVKLVVWKRDGGKCSKCGATEDLHFDHIIPWSKGGSSTTPDNIQLLCGKHNLEKHDRIE